MLAVLWAATITAAWDTHPTLTTSKILGFDSVWAESIPVQQNSITLNSGAEWSGAVVIPRHPAWIFFEGVEWIWSHSGAEANAEIDETAAFSITVDIPDGASVTRATLDMAVDNFLDEVAINGVVQPEIRLVDPYSFSYISNFKIDPGAFHSGANIIQIITRNESGPAGAAFRITIDFSSEQIATLIPPPAEIPENIITPTVTPPPVTKETIKKEFLIEMVDGGSKSWDERELRLVKEVLDSLPAKYKERLKFLKTIYREKTKNGSYGCFNCKDKITIYDNANKANDDFNHDPNGDKQFKGTLLHELTHAYLSYKDISKQYKDTFSNPILIDYINEINTVEGKGKGWNLVFESKMGFMGWGLDLIELKWKLESSKENPPTDYGKNQDPEEDLCESIMFYMLDPENLEKMSKTRYNFIKKQLFFDKEFK